MDDFKKCMFHDIGPGGLNCPCCNQLTHKQHGHKDPDFHRITRSRMKMNDKEEIKSGIEEYDTRYDENFVFNEDTQEQQWLWNDSSMFSINWNKKWK